MQKYEKKFTRLVNRQRDGVEIERGIFRVMFGGIPITIQSTNASAEVIALHGELLPVVYSESFYQSLKFVVVAQDSRTQKTIGVVTARYTDEDLGQSVPRYLVRSNPYAYISVPIILKVESFSSTISLSTRLLE